MKNVQSQLLDFIEDDDRNEENFEKLCTLINDLKICDDKHELMSFLHLVLKISNNYHRKRGFINKIEKIILYYKDKITANLTNFEIFNILKSNKRILLFLHDQKIIKFDENILRKLLRTKYVSRNYLQYFMPELKPYMTYDFFRKERFFEYFYLLNSILQDINKTLPEDFYEKRLEGENDDFLCKLIREDSIKDFIAYVNRKQGSFNNTIQPSIYETNLFLMKNDKDEYVYEYDLQSDKNHIHYVTLIEYAAFFGASQIFSYLLAEKVQLDSSIWLYAIHGQNPEIIKLLEDKKIVENNDKCLKEAIKCHHNDIVNYFLNNFEKTNLKNIQFQSLQYYNYNFIQTEMINESSFYDICKYDYYIIASNLLKEKKIDVNSKYKTYEYTRFRIWYSLYDGLQEPEKIECYKTALFRAIEKENIEIVKLLLSNEHIDVNQIIQYELGSSLIWYTQKTLLFLAIENNNIEIVKLLLSNENIDVNIKNIDRFEQGSGEITIYKYTALHESVEQENVEIVKLLLLNKNIVVNECGKKRIDIKSGDQPYEGRWYRTALFRAIDKENVEIVNLLLNHKRININAYNCKLSKDEDILFWEKDAFYRAVEKENIEIIKALLNYDFNINRINFDCAYKDADDDIDFINSDEVYIEKYREDIKRGEKTALYLAVMKKNLKIVKLLLTNPNIDLNIYNTDGDTKNTVLDLAIENKLYEITKLLNNYKSKHCKESNELNDNDDL